MARRSVELASTGKGKMARNEVRERTRGQIVWGRQGLAHSAGHARAVSGLKGQSECCVDNTLKVNNRRSRRPVGSVCGGF